MIKKLFEKEEVEKEVADVIELMDLWSKKIPTSWFQTKMARHAIFMPKASQNNHDGADPPPSPAATGATKTAHSPSTTLYHHP
jgi:hypothetical protein